MNKFLLPLILLASTGTLWLSPTNQRQQFNKDLAVLAQYMPGFSKNPKTAYNQLLQEIYQDKTANIPAMQSISKDLTKGFPNILAYSKAPCINDNDSEVKQRSNVSKIRSLLELTRTIDGEPVPTQVATKLLRSIDSLLGLLQNKKITECNTQLSALLQVDPTKELSRFLYVAGLLRLPKKFIHFLTDYVSQQLAQNLQGQINNPQLQAQIEPLIRLLGNDADAHTIQHSTKIKKGLTLQGHKKPLISAAFSHHGNKIVTASWDTTAKIWNTETGACIHTLKGRRGPINSAFFSPDGTKLITASDDTAKIWDAQTGQLLHTLQDHTSAVGSANFSPDGKLIITASLDKTAKIWNTETGTCIHTLQGHKKYVESATFSPDGKLIVTASDDCTAKIWEIFDKSKVTAAEYLLYHAFINSGLQAVQLIDGSYGAQIINQLNSRFPEDQPLIPVL